MNPSSENRDDNRETAVPAAEVSRMKRVSGLWLIPIVTLIVGLAMIYQNWASRGPLITIEFPSAQGLEAGKTKIKTRDVDVGEVEEITLNAANDGVIVYARIRDEFGELLREGSRFWVVEPTITLSGISGLNTLVTGQYILFSPSPQGEVTTHFVGLAQPPLTPLNAPGLHLTLSSDQDYSFAKGDQIHHQGINVGKIENIHFNFEDNKIYYDAFIEAPYHQLITNETRFWKNSALRAELTTEGFEVETGTVDSILVGGVSFTTPTGIARKDPPAPDKVFYVYPNRNATNKRLFQYAVQYWVMVKDSISGLNIDAPVMYRGIQVGKVLRNDEIPQGHNLLDPSINLPVLIEINPGRLGLPDSAASLQRTTADINALIRQGLTATLKSRNILLGQQMIELDYKQKPEGPARSAEPERYQDIVVIPTGVDSIQKFTTSIEELIAKLNRLPVESTLQSFQQTAQDASVTLKHIDELTKAGTDFLGKDTNTQLMGQLNKTLKAVEGLANGYSADSSTSQDIHVMMRSLSDFLEEFRPLAVQLKNSPNSLIFPKPASPELEPVRKQP